MLSSCQKPDPRPELRDPIYQDIQEKIKEVSAVVETEKKNLEEAEAKMKASVPQTGQIKYSSKKYYETEKRLRKAQQLLKFYELKLKSREDFAQDQYLLYYDDKKADQWPPKEDFIEYQSQERARFKTRVWSVKKRIEEELGQSGGSEKGEKPNKGGH